MNLVGIVQQQFQFIGRTNGHLVNRQPHSKSKMINVSGIGHIVLRRNHRARHLNLTVEPFNGIHVTVPPGIPLSQVENFVQSKKGWITKHLEQARELEKKRRQAAGLINRTDAAEAAEKLVGELDRLADRYGFHVRRVTVRNQKTRWGSCSANNNISLNINLVHLPPKLLRYVLLHELVHTRIKNHSPKFWSEMDRLVGDARKLRTQLNEFSYLLLHA